MDTENKQPTKNNLEGDVRGYIVCFGTVIIFIAGMGHINSFGLIYNDFIINTNASARSLTTAHGVFAIMLAVGGLLLNVFSKRLSMQCGATLGATLFIVGSFSTVFITNVDQLSLTFGVLQGAGFGMLVPVCYSTINYYFIRKRTTVMSSIKALQGILIMWYPQLLKLILSVYGFRGTLLMLAGISLHMVPGVLTMQTWKTSKKVLRKDKDVEKCENAQENIDLLTNNEEFAVKSKVALIWSEILEILNVKVLKDITYCNICIGQSFVNFSDLLFFILQPILLFQYGFDKSQVAACISIGAGADVAGRFGLALISGIYSLNTRLLYYVATLFTLIARIGILYANKYLWIAILTGLLGVLRAILHVASPLVISNHVSHDQFPGAYALFMLSAGTINVVMSPVIGSLKDYFGSYIPAFVALVLCLIPCLILWPLEYILLNKKRNVTTQ